MLLDSCKVAHKAVYYAKMDVLIKAGMVQRVRGEKICTRRFQRLAKVRILWVGGNSPYLGKCVLTSLGGTRSQSSETRMKGVQFEAR